MRHALYIFTLCLLLAPGARAEDALSALGAIVDAAAPIAIAGVEAGADKAIARINADAAVRMTQISSDTTEYLANDQKDIALYQAMTAERVIYEDQRAATERLAIQLGSLADARHGAERSEEEKLMIEQQYNQERIALAKQEADNTVMLAKAQLNAQISVAGLSANFAYSGSHLTLGTPRSFGGSLSLMANNSVVGRSRAARDDSQNTANDATSDTAEAPPRVVNTPRAIPAMPGSTAARATPSLGPRTSKVPGRLLASLGSSGSSSRLGSVSARALGPQLRSGVRGTVVRQSVVRGSFPGTPVKSQDPAPTVSQSVRAARFSGRPHLNSGSANLLAEAPLGDEGTSEIVSIAHRRSENESSPD